MKAESITDISLLEGQVRKASLPVVKGAPGPDAPRCKRLLLGQGELAHFYDGDEGARYVAVLELRASAVRGNHYHLSKQEWVYIIEGAMLLFVEDRQTRERHRLKLEAGDVAVINPGVVHAYQTLEPGRAVECSPTRFDATDVYPYPLVQQAAGG